MKTKCRFCDHEYYTMEKTHCPECGKKFELGKRRVKPKFFQRRDL